MIFCHDAQVTGFYLALGLFWLQNQTITPWPHNAPSLKLYIGGHDDNDLWKALVRTKLHFISCIPEEAKLIESGVHVFQKIGS